MGTLSPGGPKQPNNYNTTPLKIAEIEKAGVFFSEAVAIRLFEFHRRNVISSL